MPAARHAGICAQGYERLRSLSVPELIRYYITNPDWCLERNFPSLDLMRQYKDSLEEHGVFIDRKFSGETLNSHQAYIFHNCRGHFRTGLNVDLAIIPMLYLANSCRLSIKGSGDFPPPSSSDRPIIPIASFGRNQLSARDNAYAIFVKSSYPLHPL